MVPCPTESRDNFADKCLPRWVVDFHTWLDHVKPKEFFNHPGGVDLEGFEERTKVLDRETREVCLCCLTDLLTSIET